MNFLKELGEACLGVQTIKNYNELCRRRGEPPLNHKEKIGFLAGNFFAPIGTNVDADYALLPPISDTPLWIRRAASVVGDAAKLVLAEEIARRTGGNPLAIAGIFLGVESAVNIPIQVIRVGANRIRRGRN
jgi:hypothetical protein